MHTQILQIWTKIGMPTILQEQIFNLSLLVLGTDNVLSCCCHNMQNIMYVPKQPWLVTVIYIRAEPRRNQVKSLAFGDKDLTFHVGVSTEPIAMELGPDWHR